MQLNIARFRANGLTKGGARPSHFEVIFPNLPNLITPVPTAVQMGTSQMTFLATAASLPAARTDAIPVYYFGRQVYYPGERTFEPWSVSILNDEDFKLRNFFEAWSNQMNSFVGNEADSSDPRTYKVDDVTVRQWSKDGNLIREYRFFGMFPVIVGDIQLSWDQGNRIETFDVRFVYDWWQPAISGQPDQIQTSPATYDVGDTGDLTGLSSRVINGTNSPQS